MVLGITGGVGTGKSTVLEYLESRYGAYVIRLDDVARQLQQPGEACYEPMRKLLEQYAGAACTAEDGAFNRSVIADIVFQNPALRKALNAIIHPAVKSRVRDLIASYTAIAGNGSGNTASLGGLRPDKVLIVIEAALLLEDHYDEICDEIWYVYARESARRERLKKSRGYTDEKITDMLASQRSEESFRQNCALTIDNSSENLENTYRQLDEALRLRGFFPGEEGSLKN